MSGARSVDLVEKNILSDLVHHSYAFGEGRRCVRFTFKLLGGV